MSEHIERMEVEAKELSSKLELLLQFIGRVQNGEGPRILAEQLELLEKQARAMSTYLFILKKRIQFDKDLMNALGGNHS